jgi:hypothetical protein
MSTGSLAWMREVDELLRRRPGLSPNTVKTQALSVDRKLGASSRSQAVTRAQERVSWSTEHLLRSRQGGLTGW